MYKISFNLIGFIIKIFKLYGLIYKNIFYILNNTFISIILRYIL